MKNAIFVTTIRTIGALALMVVLAAPALAQQTGATRPVIGVLNTQLIERDSLAAKGVRLERDKFLTRYQTQNRDLENQFREEDQRLTQQRNVMSPDVFQQQAEEFQQRLAVAQQESRIKQQNLQAVYQQAIAQINQEMLVIASQVAQERGINMVLPASLILFADPSMDITRPVLETLNERLPAVAMQSPEAAMGEGEGGESAAE